MDECTSEELSQVTNERCLPSSSQNPEATRHDPTPPHSKKYHISSSEQRKQYKANLSYKNEWEKIYPWVICEDPRKGSRGAWTSRGVTNWSHATELLRAHGESRCHRDAAVTAGKSKQVECGKSVLELQCSAAAKEAACRAERNRSIVLKLMSANENALLEEHLTHGASNAQYTSKFSAVMLLDAPDTWLERKQIQSLRSSPCFSILADECQDISIQEELPICCRWIVDGYPEEHFVDILHVKDVDAVSITQALTTFIEVNNLDYRRFVGQGYDGATTFSGCTNGVQRRIRTHSGHAVYIHCACHKLHLASIQAAESITVFNKMFGTMTGLWKLFYYSPKKADTLKVVQSVLNLPELKVVKPSSTRWLSHERCLSAIRKDLPALIITLQQLYQTSGDAEAYGISLILSSISGVASIFFYQKYLISLLGLTATCRDRLRL
ncbi:Zinc finger protein [Oopsacas minuta]|uniref:Zinc finger protein n=1 Tax=Oopsacas minuta TaxID=111878 RepID=A0AAV7KEA1_9METZ|nr:Zinc finger protein [Oopsacas minuta]